MEMTFTKVMIQYKNFTAFYNAIHAPQIQRNSLFSGRLKRVLYWTTVIKTVEPND